MRVFRSLVVLCLVGALGACGKGGSSPTAPAPLSESGGATVAATVTIRDIHTDRPIAGVAVGGTFTNSAGMVAVSGPQGSFIQCQLSGYLLREFRLSAGVVDVYMVRMDPDYALPILYNHTDLLSRADGRVVGVVRGDVDSAYRDEAVRVTATANATWEAAAQGRYTGQDLACDQHVDPADPEFANSSVGAVARIDRSRYVNIRCRIVYKRAALMTSRPLVTHELGHGWGLRHSARPGDAMHALQLGERPSQDEMLALLALLRIAPGSSPQHRDPEVGGAAAASQASGALVCVAKLGPDGWSFEHPSR